MGYRYVGGAASCRGFDCGHSSQLNHPPEIEVEIETDANGICLTLVALSLTHLCHTTSTSGSEAMFDTKE